MIYYLQNPCFNGFAPTDSSGTNELNSLRTHLRCVKVPDVLSLMYPSLHEGGDFGPPMNHFLQYIFGRCHFLRLVVLILSTYGRYKVLCLMYANPSQLPYYSVQACEISAPPA